MEGSEPGALGFGILVESGGGLVVEEARKMAQNKREMGGGAVGLACVRFGRLPSLFISVWPFPLVRSALASCGVGVSFMLLRVRGHVHTISNSFY